MAVIPWGNFPGMDRLISQPHTYVPQSAKQKSPVDDSTLKILSGRIVRKLSHPRSLVVESGRVSLGTTTLIGNKITIYQDDDVLADGTKVLAGTVLASGAVTLFDPVGTLNSEELTFNWVSKKGTVKDVQVSTIGLSFKAASAEIFPDHWILHDVVANDGAAKPLYSFRVKTVEVKPGDEIEGHSVAIFLGRRKIQTFQKAGINLNESTLGLRWPTPSYDGSRGVGLSFASSILVDPIRVLAGGFNISSGALPSYSLQLSRSFVSPGAGSGLVTPTSDLDERFRYGYFDFVGNRSPQSSIDGLTAKKSVIGVGSFWNQQTTDRVQRQTFDEPAEVSYEVGGLFGTTPANFYGRLEEVNLVHEAQYIRGVIGSKVLGPAWEPNPRLAFLSQFDSATFIRPGSFSWARARVGAVYQASKDWRLGFAASYGQNFGTSLYAADRLVSTTELDFRSDLQWGPRRINILLKLDPSRGRFFDKEIKFVQLAGTFEPYIAIRSFPSQVRLGIELRFDSILQQLQSRNPTRPAVKPSDVLHLP